MPSDVDLPILRLMTRADLPVADRLRAQAGWNQTSADWERFLSGAPEGCFVMEAASGVVGTATTLSYGQDLAWIGMVLVDPDHRRRGLGKALLGHCLEHLRSQGISCIKLDATPMGRPLYAALGFQDEWPLTRWATDSAPMVEDTGEDGGDVRQLRPEDWPALLDLDRPAFGVDRAHVLQALVQHGSQVLVRSRRDGTLSGYGMIRPGSRAHYLGPVVASDQDTATTLARSLMIRANGEAVFWDIPDRNAETAQLASDWGLTAQRSLMRMHCGPNLHPGNPSLIHGIVAPETG
ncbi:MAG: GNAT family N-acetyltransferase [Verrucomicrobiales bacterium]|nr:GNAT family N-acetyltransferase [Verrucomicrobiales bacterium]